MLSPRRCDDVELALLDAADEKPADAERLRVLPRAGRGDAAPADEMECALDVAVVEIPFYLAPLPVPDGEFVALGLEYPARIRLLKPSLASLEDIAAPERDGRRKRRALDPLVLQILDEPSAGRMCFQTRLSERCISLSPALIERTAS